jgi:hypothetical protein
VSLEETLLGFLANAQFEFAEAMKKIENRKTSFIIRVSLLLS